MLPDELKMVRARKVVDHGTGPFAVPLAQLTESILINESLSKLTKAVEAIEIPEAQEIEIPEYPTEITVSNLPEIQRVEIVNPPKDKDDKAQLKLLKQIAEELKKKEQYTYDIEVDSNLKEQLRGEQGVPGKNGVEITPEEIKAKLEGLEGEERLDASAIKNLDSYVKETSSHKGWTRGVKTLTGGTGVTVDNTDPHNPIVSATSSSVETFESVLRNLKSYQADYTYSNGKITSVLYTIGAESITETVNYSGDTITSIVLSGDTPSGISLTKSFNYTGTNISSFTYS